MPLLENENKANHEGKSFNAMEFLIKPTEALAAIALAPPFGMRRRTPALDSMRKSSENSFSFAWWGRNQCRL